MTDPSALVTGTPPPIWFGWKVESWRDLLNVVLVASLVFGCLATGALVACERTLRQHADTELRRYQAEAQARVAEANRRAEEARQRAEEARLQAERLERSRAWRKLHPPLAKQLSDEARKRPGRLRVVASMGDPEADAYASQLGSAFSDSGWEIESSSVILRPAPEGVLVGMWNSTHSTQEEIQYLLDALFAGDVYASFARLPAFQSRSGRRWPDDEQTPALLIGAKPPFL